jgi:zinc/manganese transport system ATP-binding protein
MNGNASTGAAIALRGATLRFGAHVIWENLDLDVAPGECLVILGPNGAGKTTLLKVMLGLLPLSAGTITIDGRPPRRGSPTDGYVVQQRLYDPDLPIRGRDLVQLGVDGHHLGMPQTRARQVDSAIEAVGAADYADAPVGLLSGGQQQRLRIAQALAGGPRLLLRRRAADVTRPVCAAGDRRRHRPAAARSRHHRRVRHP